MTALHLTQRKKRGRNTGNIYTLSVLLRQLGWSCVILSTELKERKHQLCGDALRWQAGLEGRQRKAFSRSPLPFFVQQRISAIRFLPGGAGIWGNWEGVLSGQQQTEVSVGGNELWLPQPIQLFSKDSTGHTLDCAIVTELLGIQVSHKSGWENIKAHFNDDDDNNDTVVALT